MSIKDISKRFFLITFIVLCASILFCFNSQCKELKIGLTTSTSQITIGSKVSATLINSFNNQPIQKTKSFDLYNIQNIKGLISISNKQTNTKLGAFRGPIKLIPDKKNSLVKCNNRWYRGELVALISRDKTGITIVNDINLEDYLLSVVPSEIPNTWHKEVLKAQTIAARSYALGYLGRRNNKGYDLESTVEDQVYLGISSEKKTTSQAVKETEGKILIDKEDRPLIALYHSSGGGYTDSIENLWETNEIKPSVHIQPRPDYDDKSPHFKWFRSYKITEINNLLSNLNIGEIKNFIPLSRSVSQRILWIKIIGTSGETTIRGEEFRKLLKLPSSKFNHSIEKDYIKFAGRGYGHGLGLSQWGAKALAEHGFSYEQILAYYYPETRLIIRTSD